MYNQDYQEFIIKAFCIQIPVGADNKLDINKVLYGIINQLLLNHKTHNSSYKSLNQKDTYDYILSTSPNYAYMLCFAVFCCSW